MKLLRLKTIILTFLLQVATPAFATDQPSQMMIFAAASLSDVLPEVAEAWRASGGAEIVFSFDSSSRLAKQITEGAPADLYFSANKEWMDFLEKEGHIVSGSRHNLLSNSLVLAAPPSSLGTLSDPSRLDFSGVAKLALAGEHVPAGVYAQAALESIGAWDQVKNKIVRGHNVRTVLAWLAAAEVPVGVVYKTDVLSVAGRVMIVATFASSLHPAIIYPAAMVKDAKNAKLATKFLDFCRTDTATRIFHRAGFKTAPGI